MKRLLIFVAAVAALAIAPATVGAQTAPNAVSLVHGIPGVTVDLVVDGTVVLDGFTPGSIVDITSFAGRTLTDVEVLDDTGATVIGPLATLEVPAAGNWSIVAHLDADGEPTLSSFENNLAEPAADDARLTVRHTAEAPAIDVLIGDQRPITDATNGVSSELALPAGDLVDASIALAGGNPVLDIEGVTLAADANTIVYVVGSAGDDTLDLVVQVVQLSVVAATTTTTVAETTTTIAGSTTTTTVATSTTTTAPTPSAVNTGSPLAGGSSTSTLLVIGLGGLALAGGSYLVRRRV